MHMVGWKLSGLCALGAWETWTCLVVHLEVGNCMVMDVDVTRLVAAWLCM